MVEPRWAAVLSRGKVLVRGSWGTMLAALVLAAVFFLMTRDQVTRVMTVPLHVEEDPDRVLLSALPSTVKVEVRGPWARLNRLQDHDLSPAVLDLREAVSGPLQLDPARVEVPAGVMRNRMIYDPVDLRFEPRVERVLGILADVIGMPHPDFELVRTDLEPSEWRVRGGQSVIQGLGQLRTEALDLRRADRDLEAELGLRPLPPGVEFVGASRQVPPRVRVRVMVAPLGGSRTFTVPLTLSRRVDPYKKLPRTYEVTVRGGLLDLAVLDRLGGIPVVARASLHSAVSVPSQGIEVRFSWRRDVPKDLRARLTMDPTQIQMAARPNP